MSEFDIKSKEYKKLTAREFLRYNITYVRFQDGDVYLNGELVATYEGIIK